MKYILFIVFMISILQPVSFLVASYGVTQNQLVNIKTQAKEAWPDIQDEEAFNKGLAQIRNN